MICKKIIIFPLMIVFFINCIVFAEEKKKPRKSSDAKILKGFNPDVEKLPANFKGTDIVKLCQLLEKIKPEEKSEFETTEEYNKRAKLAIPEDIYAFVAEGEDEEETIKIMYSADESLLRIMVAASICFSDMPRSHLILKTIEKAPVSYRAQNAFGATTKVRQYGRLEYGIALHTMWNDYDTQFNVNIKMSPEEAKRKKKDIRALVLCKLKPWHNDFWHSDDLLSYSSNYSQATFSHPTARFTDRTFVNAEILALWVYNFRTGEIIVKKQAKKEILN